MTTTEQISGTTWRTAVGPELLIELRRSGAPPLRIQLEDRLRTLVRDGALQPGTRLPSSRALATDLGVSRRLVADAYAQLLAEGYLQARHGSGTFVSAATATAPEPARRGGERRLQFDFFPGSPDLASFPRTVWLRALRDVLRIAPDAALGYPDPRGAPELRAALADYLRRVRGVSASAESIVVCAGATQGLVAIATALRERGTARLAVEDPCLPPHRTALERAGMYLAPIAVDEYGVDVGALATSGAGAALVTPAHQSPTGVALTPDRRAALLEWARGGRFVLEDDYDAEFRYDRAPIGALQGIAPDRVIYIGTTSKTLAPAMRLGWLVLPVELVDAVARAKLYSDMGSPTLDQLALARLIETAAYDRYLRQARRRYRRRRDALVAALREHLPAARVTGIAAGLHAVVRVPFEFDQVELVRAARRESVGVYPLAFSYARPPVRDSALVLGYANLGEAAIAEGVRRLAAVLATTSRWPRRPG
jgi:GntR family transcriptional regulator/MocR family aminotransferase